MQKRKIIVLIIMLVMAVTACSSNPSNTSEQINIDNTTGSNSDEFEPEKKDSPEDNSSSEEEVASTEALGGCTLKDQAASFLN